MSADDYQRTFDAVIQSIKDLTPEEQVRLLDDLKVIIQNNEEKEILHDVIEFRGEAKDFWKDTDVEEYIRQERDSWGNGPSYYNDDGIHPESDKR